MSARTNKKNRNLKSMDVFSTILVVLPLSYSICVGCCSDACDSIGLLASSICVYHSRISHTRPKKKQKQRRHNQIQDRKMRNKERKRIVIARIHITEKGLDLYTFFLLLSSFVVRDSLNGLCASVHE